MAPSSSVDIEHTGTRIVYDCRKDDRSHHTEARLSAGERAADTWAVGGHVHAGMARAADGSGSLGGDLRPGDRKRDDDRAVHLASVADAHVFDPVLCRLPRRG